EIGIASAQERLVAFAIRELRPAQVAERLRVQLLDSLSVVFCDERSGGGVHASGQRAHVLVERLRLFPTLGGESVRRARIPEQQKANAAEHGQEPAREGSRARGTVGRESVTAHDQ